MRFVRAAIRDAYFAMRQPKPTAADDAACAYGKRFNATLRAEQVVPFTEYMSAVTALNEEQRRRCFQCGWLAAERRMADRALLPADDCSECSEKTP